MLSQIQTRAERTNYVETSRYDDALEPRSNDGLLNWNFLDDALKDTEAYPILRTRN